MRKFLTILATAGLVAFGSGAASAQEFNVRVGVGDHGRHHTVREVREIRERRPVVRQRVIERRVRPARTRTVCRTVIRQHVRPSGAVVRRPVEICRQVVAGRRVYVD
ncbi:MULTISPECIES: hypothetical protein [Microvirga]|uniref:hypothetical protein n=1 Tax=Microvirga TaxID=186650 RepID=UPI001CFCC1A9|nr:hypothetical protein [Microvirga lenta]MCB5174670.1 hypothetical protein [Microvirga lenta]